jgi:HD-like signal output (HDOD) protein
MPDLIGEVEELGSFPAVYQQLDEALNDPDSSIGRFTEIIEHDVDLTARLLRLANSSFYGFPGIIETVGQAISLIGLQQVQEIVTARCAVECFRGVSSGFVDMESFWRHSVACGTVARVMAVYRRDPNPERLFVAGLMHDIGRLVIFLKAPEAAAEVFRRHRAGSALLVDCEREVLGTDHAELGAALVAHWGLSPTLAEAVRFHHRPHAATERPVEAAAVHVADVLTLAMELGGSGQKLPPPLNMTAWNRVGLPPMLIEAVFQDVDMQMEDVLSLFL